MFFRIFKNDHIILILDTEKNISTYTTFEIKYEKPDGSGGRWAAAIYPTNNNYLYATVQFDMIGLWRVQAYVRKVGSILHGLWVDIPVYEALFWSTAAPTTVPPTTMVPTT